MPFSGKYSIRHVIKEYIASESGDDVSRYAATQAFLVGMTAAHAYQAYLGYASADIHIGSILSREADPLTYAYTVVDGLYIAANGLVAARQANLVGRVEGIRRKKRARGPRLRPTVEGSDIVNKAEAPSSNCETSTSDKRKVIGVVAFTLAGQALFLGSYINANEQSRETVCREEASQYYQEYVNAHTDQQLIPEDDYIDNACNL